MEVSGGEWGSVGSHWSSVGVSGSHWGSLGANETQWRVSEAQCAMYIHPKCSASQPNLVMELGVHSSLNPNCNHQVVFAKFNLFCVHHLTKELFWVYEKADAEHIQRAINEFDWIRALF